MGTVEALEPGCAAFEICARNSREQRALDGAVAAGGAVVGTMIHGLFENDRLRSRLVAALRGKKGLPEFGPAPAPWSKDAEYDRVADAIGASIDRGLLERIVRGERLHERTSHGTEEP